MAYRPRKKSFAQAKRKQCKRCGAVMRKRIVRCKKCAESQG